ncbi:MAG: hypothetical protein Aurels2KO_21460 [Aureliella sp.]
METTGERRSGNLLATVLFVVLGLILMLAALAFAAYLLTAGGSAGGTLASGRSVSTSSDGFNISSKFSGDTATIETSGMVIVVEPERLLIDGKTIAAIPVDAKKVQVNVQGGEVEFIVDGEAISGP